eukprot:gene3465-6114_t
MDNPNPEVYEANLIERKETNEYNESIRDEFDSLEVYELIRHIYDPEHPLTLEQLKVIDLNSVEVDDENNYILIKFTPTVTGCSLATLIGLCIRVKLIRSLPKRFKVDILISKGSHSTEDQKE